jgi:hypothetical protein
MVSGYLKTGTIVSLLLIFVIRFTSSANAHILNSIDVSTDKSQYTMMILVISSSISEFMIESYLELPKF